MVDQAQRLVPPTIAVALSLALWLASPNAGRAEEGFHVPRDHVQFLTGDSWFDGEHYVRLYGVQACLRGKTYTDHRGQKQDCGVVSTAMLAALVRDTDPICRPVATLLSKQTAQQPTVIVICNVHLGDRDLDLGSMLISQGFAFAAFANERKPVYMPYSIQESIARQARAGLWGFDDVPVPTRDLLAH